MTKALLKDPFAIGNAPQSKLKDYEKAYVELKGQVIAQDKQISNKQTTKLKEFIKQILQIKNKVTANRTQCLEKTIKLKEEIDSYERKLKGFKIGAKILEMEAKFTARKAEEEKAYTSNCQKRIQIAEQIDFKAFKKLDIDQRKSLANEVFKWILVAVYMEPENKFYWPNFQEQVIQNTEGCEDLKQRLAKFNAYNAKQDQRVKTAKFIESFDKIKMCPEFKKLGPEIQKIYQIAKIFLACSDIGRQIKSYEAQIQAARKQHTKDDESLVQSRKECDALIEKYKLSQLYLEQLTKIEKSLSAKLELYNREVELAEAYVYEISNITISKLVTIEPRHQIQKRQQCECSIF